MNYRTSLHLLRNLLPSRRQPDAADPAQDFVDTQPVDRDGAPDDASTVTPQQFQGSAWAESAIDLAQGTEVMELPDDTAADLMDEFFTNSTKKAA